LLKPLLNLLNPTPNPLNPTPNPLVNHPEPPASPFQRALNGTLSAAADSYHDDVRPAANDKPGPSRPDTDREKGEWTREELKKWVNGVEGTGWRKNQINMIRDGY
jgi:hypothetical protein